MRVRWIVSCLLVIAGCGRVAELAQDVFGDEDDDPPAGSSDPPGADDSGKPTAGPATCGPDTFACTWAEVSLKAQAHTRKLATEALAASMGMDLDEARAAAVAAIEADDAAVVMSAHAHTVRFRVDGGRPAWVFLATPQTVGTLGGPITAPVWPWMGPPAGADRSPPVGDNPPGKKPRKKVLILSPFQWQWQVDGSTDEVHTLVELFEEVPDYKGGVQLRVNALAGSQIDYQVGIESFMEWSDYDVIHVSTHGTSCAKDTPACATALATGDTWAQMGVGAEDDAVKDFLRTEGIDVGFIPILASNRAGIGALEGIRVSKRGKKGEGDSKAAMAGSKQWIAGPFVLVNTTFFEKTYRDKLDDKLIFLSACRSGAKSDLAEALAGDQTAVIGWNKVMGLFTASQSAKLFWALLLGAEVGMIPAKQGGRTADKALELMNSLSGYAGVMTRQQLKSVVIEGNPTVDDTTGAKLGPTGEANTRAREIVGLVVDEDGKTRPMRDGDALPLVGVPGDGKPDELELTAEVIGLGPDEDPAGYVIHLDVDGKTVEHTWKPSEKIADGVWRGETKVELGFDVAFDDPVALEPWVTMPTGGTSRWRYEDLRPEYLVLKVTGPPFASEQTFSIDPDQVNLHGFSDNISMMFIDRGLSSATPAGDLLRGKAKGSRRASSEDGSYVQQFSLSVQGADAKAYTIGSDADVSLGMSSAAGSPENCPEYANGCHSIGLSDESGKVTLEAYVPGKAAWRPGESAPTSARGTFEVQLERTNIKHRGERYTVRGSFNLID